jgi:hypothetical protein
MILTAHLASGQPAVFFRATSTNRATITSFDRIGLLTIAGSVTNMPVRLETAPTPSGPWGSNFSHTVVRTAGREMLALVPIGPTSPPRTCCDSNLAAQVRDTILLEGSLCRLKGTVYYDFMPGTERTNPITAVTITVPSGEPFPQAAAVTLVRVSQGPQVWEVPYSSLQTLYLGTNNIYTGANGGPQWSIGTAVDVLAQVTVRNVNYLLCATNILVDAVY